MRYSCLNGWTNYTSIDELIEEGQFPRSNVLELARILDKDISNEQIYNFFEDKREDYLPIVLFNSMKETNYEALKEELNEYCSGEDSEQGDFFNMLVMALFCARKKYSEKWEKYLNYNYNSDITFEQHLKLFEDVINYVLDVIDIPTIKVCEYRYQEDEPKYSYYDRIYYRQDVRKVYLVRNDFSGYYQETMYYWVFQVVSKIMLYEIEENEEYNEYLNISSNDVRELKKDTEQLSKVYNGIANVLSQYYGIYSRSK